MQAAIDAANRRLELELGAASGDILARSDHFDADTSLGYRPERQTVWRAQVRSELARTQHLAVR